MPHAIPSSKTFVLIKYATPYALYAFDPINDVIIIQTTLSGTRCLPALPLSDICGLLSRLVPRFSNALFAHDYYANVAANVPSQLSLCIDAKSRFICLKSDKDSCPHPTPTKRMNEKSCTKLSERVQTATTNAFFVFKYFRMVMRCALCHPDFDTVFYHGLLLMRCI